MKLARHVLAAAAIFGMFCPVEIALSQVDPQIQRYRDDPKGNAQYRREAVLGSNRIVTLFSNDAEIGHWPFQPSGVWPKGTDHSYLDGYALLIGAKIVAPGNGAIVTPIESAYREEIDKDPVTEEEWVLQPVPGYVKPSATKPAMSNDPLTYPDAWPTALNLTPDWNGEWYGYAGKGPTRNFTETFYVMDDSKDREITRSPFSYYPVQSDSGRGGLGLRVEVRGMQSPHPFVQDVIFWHYRVTNISDHSYDTSSFGFYLDPGVGGTNNTGNSARVDAKLDFLYAWSPNGPGVPGNWKPGYIGFGFLKTPEDLGLTDASIYVLSDKGPTGGWPKNDDVIWGKMTNGFADTVVQNTNISVVMATGPFSFPKWATDTISALLIFADDVEGLMAKKSLAQEIHRGGYALPDSATHAGPVDIHILTPQRGESVSGTTPITWTTSGNAGKTVTLLFSSRDDSDWVSIGLDTANSGIFNWNTQGVRDGIFYRIQILCIAENGIGYREMDSTFPVNNPGNVPPEIQLLSPRTGSTVSGNWPISWIAGDADGDQAHVSLYYRPSSVIPSWIPIVQDLTAGSTPFLWSTQPLPNELVQLRADAVAGVDTTRVITDFVRLSNDRVVVANNHWITQRKSNGTGLVEAHILDSTSVTGDDYALAFVPLPGTAGLGYNVTNLRTGQNVVANALASDSTTEGPYFDGLRLVVVSDSVAVIDSATGWSIGSSNLVMNTAPDQSVPSRDWISPSDYDVVWYDTAVDSTLFSFPPRYPKIPLNFQVTNVTEARSIRVIVDDNDRSLSLTPDDTIRFIERFISASDFKFTMRLTYGKPLTGSPVFPAPGDRYIIRTSKPYAAGDSIIFSSLKVLRVMNGVSGPPGGPFLSQNYPNPFNPTTTIRYTIPVRSHVELSVFNTLGQKVAVVVHTLQDAGYHEVRFDGAKLASGVYFYRLQVGQNVQTGSMILLK